MLGRPLHIGGFRDTKQLSSVRDKAIHHSQLEYALSYNVLADLHAISNLSIHRNLLDWFMASGVGLHNVAVGWCSPDSAVIQAKMEVQRYYPVSNRNLKKSPQSAKRHSN